VEPEERLMTLREAAALFDPPKSLKALEQIVNRGHVQVHRERDPSGRTLRVRVTRAALEEYISRYARGDVKLKTTAEAPERTDEEYRQSAREKTQRGMRRAFDQLVRENAELRLRVAQLEEELEHLRTPTESSRS
jgi:hypothetical protein